MIVFVLACSSPEAPAGPAPVLSVEQAPADVATRATEPLIGRVVAMVDEEVSAHSEGHLLRFHVGLGDTVEAGSPLAELDNPGLLHRVDRARARAASAKAEMRGAAVRASAAEKESESVAGLGTAVAAKRAIAAAALAKESGHAADALRATADEARSELAQLDAARTGLTVVSGSAGRVAALYKRPGELVVEGEPVLRLLSQGQQVRFAASAEIPLRIGQALTIRTRAGDELQGQVARIAPEVDSAGLILAETAPLPSPLRNGDVAFVELAP